MATTEAIKAAHPVSFLGEIHDFFMQGETHSYEFRKEQLKKLKQTILRYEEDIYAALYSDLKKSKEESYASEVGLLLSEINVALKNLRRWMQPQAAGTDLVNLPSKSKIYRDPLGVVLIISPWNYPLQLLLIPLVSAIAGGNCIVLKPSELAPATANIIEKIIKETFHENYIKVVQGDGAKVIPQMMESFRFDHVFYTGSIPVGKMIYQQAAKNLIPVTLELGGKSPAIVEPDAKLDVAARRIVLGKFLNAGQTCIAPDYLLVHESIRDKFIDKLKNTIEQFYTTDPSGSYDYGKIINERRFDKLVSYLQEGRIITGGLHDRSKLYIAPTLVDDVPENSLLWEEEIFGPIFPVRTYKTTGEAIDYVKKSNPLALYLFTSGKKKEQQWINNVPFGGGCINNAAWHFTNHHLPFGGVGNSGIGSYHGKFGFDTFTRMKPVMKTPAWFDPLVKYPPFKGKLKLFKWVIR